MSANFEYEVLAMTGNGYDLNLLKLVIKFCQITSSEFNFGLVLAIWNYCAAASEVRSLLILLEAPARRSLVAAAAVRTGGCCGVPRTAPHTPALCRGAQHHQAISTPPRGCWYWCLNEAALSGMRARTVHCEHWS